MTKKEDKTQEMDQEEVVEKSLEEKCNDYLSGWKQALADYDNLKKDLEKEREHFRLLTKERVASELLPVLDNFFEAKKYTPEVEIDGEAKVKIENWLQGIEFIYTQLTKVLEGIGVEEINTSGVFDAEIHDCAGERSEDGKNDGEILEVIQKGWKIGDRLIRPAKVIIQASES